MNDVFIWCLIALLGLIALAPVIVEFLGRGDDK